MDLYQIINPFPEQKTKIYGTISNRSKVNDKWLITMDLINNEVRNLDEQLYTESSKDNFKYESKKELLFTYFMKVEIDLDSYENNYKNLSDDKLYEVELVPEELVNNKNINLLHTYVYFSASPISRKKYFTSFTGVSLPLKGDPLCVAPLTDLSDINLALNRIFSYTLKVDVFRVHKVGQGSCNSIIFKSQNECKLFYDIGVSKYSKKDPLHNLYVTRLSMFNLKKFETVILSHWDEDHYLGVYFDDSRELLNKKWITPPIEINNVNASRLAYLINLFGELIIIDDSIKGHFYHKDDIYLFKGNGTDKNDKGIIVCINNSIKSLVAMGDVSYNSARFIYSFLHGCFNKIDYLVVPHHGADLSSMITFSPKTKESIAIISVGYNTYHHPSPTTESYLSAKGFRVIRTDYNERLRIEF